MRTKLHSICILPLLLGLTSLFCSRVVIGSAYRLGWRDGTDSRYNREWQYHQDLKLWF